MTNKGRIYWVDNARGVAILLVVLGHVSYMPEAMHKVIYAFHMPLFFILSGLFLDERIVEIPFIHFLSKKARSLMVPFFVFGILNVLFFFVLNSFSLSGPKSFNLAETMMDSLFFVRHSGKWFLCGLFFSQILLYLIYKFSWNPLVTTSILFVGGGHNSSM